MRENILFLFIIEFIEVLVVVNEINLNNGLNDIVKEKSWLYKNGLFVMIGV